MIKAFAKSAAQKIADNAFAVAAIVAAPVAFLLAPHCGFSDITLAVLRLAAISMTVLVGLIWRIDRTFILFLHALTVVLIAAFLESPFSTVF